MLTTLHEIIGLLFLLGSLFAAIWAYIAYRRRRDLPPGYWHLLRGTAGLLALQVILGILFVSLHMMPREPIHFMYAGLVTLTVAACELLRPTASLGRILREEGNFREAGVYAALTLLAALFALRLWMTGLGMP